MLNPELIQKGISGVEVLKKDAGKSCVDVVSEALSEFNLEEESIRKFFGFLVNGKKVGPDDVVRENDEVKLIIKFAGGK